jgi:hypothetical protein
MPSIKPLASWRILTDAARAARNIGKANPLKPGTP